FLPIDSRLVSGHVAASLESCNEAKNLVRVNKHRRPRVQRRWWIKEQEGQGLPALGPVLEEVVGKRTVTLGPEAEGAVQGGSFRSDGVVQHCIQHHLVIRAQETQGLQRLAKGGALFDRPPGGKLQGPEQPFGRKTRAQVEALPSSREIPSQRIRIGISSSKRR